jgi:hypothetical protein
VPAEEVKASKAHKARLKDARVRSQEAARRDIALTQIKPLADAKPKSTRKGWLLFLGLAFEVLAVVCGPLGRG